MPKTEQKTVYVKMPVPNLGQNVRCIIPFNAAFDGFDMYQLPEGAEGTVVEVEDGPMGYVIGIDIDQDHSHLTEGVQMQIADWAHAYHNATGNGRRLYIYDSASYVHNDAELAGLFEFHHHFKYVT